MPIQLSKTTLIAYLQEHITNNKAKGLLAETRLHHDLTIGEDLKAKFLAGAWLISPKGHPHHRHCIFVAPHLYETTDELEIYVDGMQNNKKWQTLINFLADNKIVIVVTGAIASKGNLTNTEWVHFVADRNQLRLANPFAFWEGSRGRPSRGKAWEPSTETAYTTMSNENLMALALREAFYNEFLKRQLQKPVEDPYDVDGFIISDNGVILPLEIKEKSRTPKGEFGVDAGRILMLLRLCLLTDCNALYLIREIDNSPTRNFIEWQYITLADLIMHCRWNLQAGGAGMGGGSTQTIMMAGHLFKPFTSSHLQEAWLKQSASLRQALNIIAEDLIDDLAIYFNFLD